MREKRLCVCMQIQYLHISVLWSNFMLELFVTMIQLAYGLEKSLSIAVFCLWFYRIVPLEGSIVEVKFAF